ncbi:MAG TPA: helix-turn-helix transcriptional regulator [Longimicrobiales bacterium]|nr:helix-turn-helix transcriptional regulator [Longimicrobiales bacterium]
MNDAASLIPLNPRDYLILFSLVEEDRHGYGIVKHVETGSLGGVRLDPANLYRAMKRMIGDGLVEETDGPTDGDAAADRRKYYRVTALGREVVQLEARRLAELTAAARALDLIPGGEPA